MKDLRYDYYISSSSSIYHIQFLIN